MKSASGSKALNSATLNVGGLTGSFSVTTIEDTIAPNAQIMFPTPVSLTEGNSILVRGVASDSVNEIENLTVNGVPATTTDGYVNWQAEVPLKSGTNNLVVSVKDAANNIASSAATVNIKSGPLAENRTSDSEYALEDPVGVVIDPDRNRLIVMDRVNNISFRTVAIDLQTSSQLPLSRIGYYSNFFGGLVIDKDHNRVLSQNVRTTWATDLESTDVTKFYEDPRNYDTYGLNAIALDAVHNHLLIVDAVSDEIKAVDLTSGIPTTLSSNTIPSSTNSFVSPQGIAIDTENNQALVTDYSQNAFSILIVNLTTGARTVLSANSVPDTNTPLVNPTYITLDKNRNRALVSDREAIIAVDLTTGARSAFTGNSVPDDLNKLSNINAITVDAIHDIAFIASYKSGAVYTLDLITGKRVVFAK